MTEVSTSSSSKKYGSAVIDEIVEKLRSTTDPRRRYEYVLWLGKKLPLLPKESLNEAIKVKGCVSSVYVLGELEDGRINWKGFSDSLITKGLLALLVKGLSNLTPEQVSEVDVHFIEETGLRGSLTPSRANGFLNILLNMKAQARSLAKQEAPTNL